MGSLWAHTRAVECIVLIVGPAIGFLYCRLHPSTWWLPALQAKGYLPDAMVNFLALLGWSPRTDKEFFSMEELTEAFSLEGISKNSVTVDEDKLMWMNKQHWKACVQQPARLRQLAMDLQDILTTPSVRWDAIDDFHLRHKIGHVRSITECSRHFWWQKQYV